jgi:hypothetical protein
MGHANNVPMEVGEGRKKVVAPGTVGAEADEFISELR